MPTRLRFPVALLTLSLLTPTLRAAEPLADAVGRAVSQRPGWYVVDGQWLRPTATLDWADLVRIRIDPAAGPTLAGGPTAAGERVLQLGRRALVILRRDEKDPGRPYLVSAAGRQWLPGREGFTDALQVRAVDEPGVARRDGGAAIESVDLMPTGAAVEAVVEGRRVSLRIGAARVGVTVTDSQADADGPAVATPRETAAAADFLELQRAEPVETRQFVAPVLELLNGGSNPLAPRAGDVYRAFPSIDPTPAANQAVAAAIVKLSSADPAARRRAAAGLDALGRPGALAAVRVNSSKLPPEARLRLEGFVASQSYFYRTPPADLRADGHFLIDCLGDPDPRVRSAAAGALSKLLGERVDPATADRLALHGRFAPGT